MRGRVLLLIVVTILCLTDAAARPLKLGVISGLGGIAAKWNRYQNMGIELAREELTREGWEIELVYEDSASLPTKGISAFEKLLAADKVRAVLADDFGFVIAPLLPRIAERHVFFVAISLPHDHYCKQGGGYFFSATSQVLQAKEAFRAFFTLHPEVRRIAMITYDDREWGSTYKRMWREIAAEEKVEVVDSAETTEQVPEYKSILARFLTRKPEAIFLAHEPETFFKVAKQLGYSGHVVSANNLLEMLSDSEQRSELEGVYLVDPEISEDFRRRFRERFGLAPILEAYAGYELLRSIVRAFELNPEHPELGMKGVRYTGVAGEIDFTGPSCAGNLARWGLFRFEGGKMVAQRQEKSR